MKNAQVKQLQLMFNPFMFQENCNDMTITLDTELNKAIDQFGAEFVLENLEKAIEASFEDTYLVTA